MIIEITSPEQLAELIKTEPKLIVDYWATWCGPCKALKMEVEQKKADLESNGITFATVNVDDQRDLAIAAEITTIPTLEFYVGGKEFSKSNSIPLASMIDLING